MVTSRIDNRAEATYVVVGLVVDRRTRQGIAGAMVEARERDTRYHDMLGQTITGEQGNFTIGFEPEDWGDFAPEQAPDLFFRVFIDGLLVLDTIENTLMNVPRGRTSVTLEVDRPTLPEAGPDRVSVEQLVKAVDWWRACDFRGVAREGGRRFGSVGSVLGDQFARKVAVWDFKPVRPSGPKEAEIVAQPVPQAQAALAAQQVTVADVRTVDGSSRATLRTLADLPLALKAGDRVVLYQEDGVVRYYTRLPEQPASSIDQQAVAALGTEVQDLKLQLREVESLRGAVGELRDADRHVAERLGADAETLAARTAEVEQLQRELLQLRQAGAEKDVRIAQLDGDLRALRSAQDALATRLPLSRLEALEERVLALSRPREFAPAQAAELGREGPLAAAPAASPADAPSGSRAETPARLPVEPPPAAEATRRARGRKTATGASTPTGAAAPAPKPAAPAKARPAAKRRKPGPETA